MSGLFTSISSHLSICLPSSSDRYEYIASVTPGEKIATQDAQLIKTQAARDQTRNRQRDLSNSIAMIAVGLPLYIYHWKTIQKKNKK